MTWNAESCPLGRIVHERGSRGVEDRSASMCRVEAFISPECPAKCKTVASWLDTTYLLFCLSLRAATSCELGDL